MKTYKADLEKRELVEVPTTLGNWEEATKTYTASLQRIPIAPGVSFHEGELVEEKDFEVRCVCGIPECSTDQYAYPISEKKEERLIAHDPRTYAKASSAKDAYTPKELREVLPQEDQEALLDEMIEERDRYRDLVVQILLQIEYGNPLYSIQERIAQVINKDERIRIGHNPTTKSAGISFTKKPKQ